MCLCHGSAAVAAAGHRPCRPTIAGPSNPRCRSPHEKVPCRCRSARHAGAVFPKAQRTYAKTLLSAEQQYGPGERASRTAFATLKRGFEKVDDRWVAKRRKGPSDPRSAGPRSAARRNRGETYGGVDGIGHTRAELYRRATALGIRGRSTMRKAELAQAIGDRQKS
ncbi:ChaB family protein [Hydrogenophaga sp. YM1]|uniref:ChaB family protein n=1 Tax=Hydrogenophaga sp. YM1 TaxID=2806262 RepID=UPI00195CD2D5|nr:ChaB family protein [Hydrogenophaga sp. YM1]QRR32605.1 ChaB family protein [Hydrogenophaga sp. YM1]